MMIVVDKFRDVISLNTFIARRPDKARLVFKVAETTGLWQLDILEGGRSYTIGSYVDGYEDKAIEYDAVIRLEWGGYVNEQHGDAHVLWLSGDDINIALPHEYDAKVAITAPRVCGHGNPLLEPVYIWRDAVYYYVLDCAGDLYTLKTIEELENFIRGLRCTEGHNVIHWLEWYVLPGVTNSEEKWSDVVKRGVAGRYDPSPDDVIKLVQKHLAP